VFLYLKLQTWIVEAFFSRSFISLVISFVVDFVTNNSFVANG
ncbi:4668_t:CDS:1, partial [Gigaspora margarita]